MRLTKQEKLALHEQQAAAYSAMYEAASPAEAASRYSDAKEAFYSAIANAQQLRAIDVSERLESRLHISRRLSIAIFMSLFGAWMPAAAGQVSHGWPQSVVF
jgi:hypothetical protein